MRSHTSSEPNDQVFEFVPVSKAGIFGFAVMNAGLIPYCIFIFSRGGNSHLSYLGYGIAGVIAFAGTSVLGYLLTPWQSGRMRLTRYSLRYEHDGRETIVIPYGELRRLRILPRTRNRSGTLQIGGRDAKFSVVERQFDAPLEVIQASILGRLTPGQAELLETTATTPAWAYVLAVLLLLFVILFLPANGRDHGPRLFERLFMPQQQTLDSQR